MDVADEQAEVDEGNVAEGPRRRRRGVRARIGPRRKYQWKPQDSSSATQSTSESSTSDASVEEYKETRRTCEKPHICPYSEGFSESCSENTSTDTEDLLSESDQSDISLRKRGKRRTTFLSKRARKAKKVGCLHIADGVDDDDNGLEDGEVYDDENQDIDEDHSNDNYDKGLGDDGEDNTDEKNEAQQADESSCSMETQAIDLSNLDANDCDEILGNLNDETEPGASQPVSVTEKRTATKPIKPAPTEAGNKSSAAKLDEPAPSDLDANLNQQAAAPSDPDTCLAALKQNLTLLLPVDWNCDIVENAILRIFRLNSSKSAAVQASIYYDNKNASVGLFINGVPVSRFNKVFECKNVPDSRNVGSVADYLCELVERLSLFQVCDGLEDYEGTWEMSAVFPDYSSSLELPCYRHVKCLYLIPAGKFKLCFNCRAQNEKCKKEITKREKGEVDPINLRDKFLTREGMKAKKDKYRMMYRAEKQRADRLEKRNDALKIKLDEVLQDELSSILRSNQHKMTPLQRIFWEDQMKVLALDDKRGMRWHPMLIRLALHLHSLSDAAYQVINNSTVFTLPSSRRLYDYSHFIEAKEGCQPEILAQIREKLEKCGEEDHFYYINLMFDEMHIRSGLVFRAGELVGYTSLSGVEEELEKMQNELNSKKYKPRLAKKVLVYMAQGITSNVKDVVAVFSTDDLSASHLYDRTWDVIYHLEEAKIKVLTLTCDGASVNRKFIAMHESLDKSFHFFYITKNLASGDSRPLFFILDAPHLLKTIRNAIANSFSHKKSRKLWKKGQFLSWKVIEALYEITKSQKFCGHKLTKAHVKLTSFSCMTVLYATQVLSDSVANSIEEHKNHEALKPFQTEELVGFIRLMNTFFDCVNGKDGGEEKTSPNKAPYTDPNDARLSFLENDFLGYFEEWKEDVLGRPGIFSVSDRNRMIVSHQALGAPQITVKGLAGAIRFMLTEAQAPSVGARKFNQDPLEQYFSIIRRKQGDNRNPNLDSFLHTRLNVHAQGALSLPSQRGNTEVQKRKEIEIDDTPLPSRKVPRK